MPLVNGHYPLKDRLWLVDGQPATPQRCSLPLGRYGAVADLSALTTQVMTAVAIPLQAGDIVTNLTFVSGATAAGTPTNWWFALYDTSATPALIAQTADQTSTAWAAHTAMTLALATAYTVVNPGLFYAAIMVKATTPPSLEGATLENAVAAGAILTGMKVLAKTSGSSLTTTAPATLATPTTVNTVPLCYIS